MSTATACVARSNAHRRRDADRDREEAKGEEASVMLGVPVDVSSKAVRAATSASVMRVPNARDVFTGGGAVEAGLVGDVMDAVDAFGWEGERRAAGGGVNVDAKASFASLMPEPHTMSQHQIHAQANSFLMNFRENTHAQEETGAHRFEWKNADKTKCASARSTAELLQSKATLRTYTKKNMKDKRD